MICIVFAIITQGAIAASTVGLLCLEPAVPNGKAVMELLAELHTEDATICMVTHDERYAQRTVYMFDGRIADQEQAAKEQIA